ncbi:hypothetical protein [Streptomyces chumphonensis]|uniref:hypothetical protein n=1 Tax=Streptomyces chumphonensis TaxID=1214925 RepID=UPI003D72401A
MTPDEELRAAAETLRGARVPAAMTNTPVGAALIAARNPLATWLDEAARAYVAAMAATPWDLDGTVLDDLAAAAITVADEETADLRKRAEQAEAALARVRAVVTERRAEVAEYEAESPPSGWSDAVTVTCDRIDYALRAPAKPQAVYVAADPKEPRP